MNASIPHRYPLHIHICALVVALVLLIGGTIGYISYTRSTRMIEDAASDVFARMTANTVGELRQLTLPAVTSARLLAKQRIVLARSLPQRLESLSFLRDVINSSPALSSVYVGYASGDMILMRRIGSAAQARALDAPAGAAYLVQSIEGAGSAQAHGRYLYYSAQLAVLRADDRPDYLGYDPRQRPWYTLASNAADIVRTDPYVFFLSGNAGITLAQRSSLGPATVGLDMELGALCDVLVQQKATPHSELAIFDEQRQVIAYLDAARITHDIDHDGGVRLAKLAELNVPALASLEPAINSGEHVTSQFNVIKAAGENWRVALSTLKAEGLPALYLAQAVPEDELLAEPRQLRRSLAIATLAVILLAVMLSYALSREISRPLRRLANEAEAVRRFDFADRTAVDSYVLEVSELAGAMASMKRTIRRFMDINSTIAAEEDFERLLPHLLSETADAASAHGGALFLADAGGNTLTLVAVRVDADNQTPIGAGSYALTDMPQLLQDAIGAGHTLAAVSTITQDDAQRCGLATHPPRGTAVAVPLLNRKRKLVGAMLLWGCESGDPVMLDFISSLSGSAAISLETRELLKAQKDLFEALIQLVAGAIDTKSPYTGGHCARVPELTKMLVRAACDANEGTYKDFQLNDDEWEAVHVAAWLHDCGKVTTPEFVVDKATKLETIYNRIHEIRMRFEVLKRDAEIGCLQGILGGQDVAEAHAALYEQWRVLDTEFAFIAGCNEGAEFLSPDDAVRIKKIGSRTWLRTLDDRLGLSWEERQRKERVVAMPPPVTEALLDDKAEHVIERRPEDQTEVLTGPGNRWGFKLETPPILYNRGEIYNLSVSRGTLSAEERYKINDHMVQTIVMLSQLPFPKHLRDVPEMAGGHHEKMDGTGYPKGLTREDMTPVARMMAIADIFEALTAADRPYKKGKTLSESIRILSFMAKDNHIDAELFDLFLRAGVHLDYARRYMRPEQIDDVDTAQYLSPPEHIPHRPLVANEPVDQRPQQGTDNGRDPEQP